MSGRPWRKQEHAAVRRWYGKVPTPTLAHRLQRTATAVRVMANTLGVIVQPRHSQQTLKAIRRMHGRGLPDRVIAAKLGLTHDSVKDLRRVRLHLPCNFDFEAKRQSIINQARRLGIKPGGQLRLLAFRNYALRHGWPGDLRPRAVQILNCLAAQGPMTKIQLAKAVGLRWKNLPSRKVLGSNDPEGSYLANLIARGLVVQLGRRYKSGYHWEMVYSLALSAERNLPHERTA